MTFPRIPVICLAMGPKQMRTPAAAAILAVISSLVLGPVLRSTAGMEWGHAYAAQLLPPAIGFEHAHYQTVRFDEGTMIRDMEIEIRRFKEGLSPARQEITTSMYDGRTRSVFISTLRMDPGCSGLSMTWEKTTSGGDSILTERISLDPGEGFFPPDSYPLFSLPYVLRGLQTNRKPGSEIATVLPGGLMLGFKLKKGGISKVKVPAGEFQCWKVSLLPDVKPLLGFKMPFVNQALRPFLPKVQLWFDLQHPYTLVKQISIASIPPNDIKSVDQLVKITHISNDE